MYSLMENQVEKSLCLKSDIVILRLYRHFLVYVVIIIYCTVTQVVSRASCSSLDLQFCRVVRKTFRSSGVTFKTHLCLLH